MALNFNEIISPPKRHSWLHNKIIILIKLSCHNNNIKRNPVADDSAEIRLGKIMKREREEIEADGFEHFYSLCDIATAFPTHSLRKYKMLRWAYSHSYIPLGNCLHYNFLPLVAASSNFLKRKQYKAREGLW